MLAFDRLFAFRFEPVILSITYGINLCDYRVKYLTRPAQMFPSELVRLRGVPQPTRRHVASWC